MHGESEAGVRVRLLGPLTVERDGHPVPLPPAESLLMRALAAAAPRPVSLTTLTSALWPESAPPNARASLHNHLSRLRTKLGPAVLTSDQGRYRLTDVVAIDLAQLREALRRGEQALGHGRLEDALAQAQQGSALVAELDAETLRDLQHLDGLPQAIADIEELEAAALVALGRVASAVPLLVRIVDRHPLRERSWALLISALRASGRRAEAVEAWLRGRRLLMERAGLEPGSELRRAAEPLWSTPAPPPSTAPLSEPDSLASVRAAEIATIEQALRDGCDLLAVVGEATDQLAGLTSCAALATRGSGPAEQHAAALHVHIRCDRSPREPLQPLRSAVAQLATMTRADLDPQSDPDVRLLFGLDGGRSFEPVNLDVPHRLVNVWTELAQAVPRVVLLVEDVHLAGPTSVAGLARVARAGTQVVVTVPDDLSLPTGLHEAERVVLPALDQQQVRRLAGMVLDLADDVLDDVATWVHDVSGGAIDAVLELAELLRLDPDAALSTPSGAARLATDLVERQRAQLEAAHPTVRRAVEIAALGDVEVTAAVLPRLLDATSIAIAITQGLVRADGAGVTSPSLRRIVLGLLAPATRAELHAAIADEAARAGLPTAVVAEHREAAATLDPVAAVQALRDAGDEAVAAVAFGEAAAWFRRAATVGQAQLAPLDRLELEVAAGNAARLAGEDGHVETLLAVAEEVLASSGSPDERWADLRRAAALGVVQLGGTSESGGLNERAAAIADRALASEVDPLHRAVLAAAATTVHSMAGAPERCRELFDDAETLTAGPVAGADPAAVAEARRRVLPYTYLSLGMPGDLDRRERLARELRDGGEQAGDREAAYEGWHLLYSVGLQRGDGALVREAVSRLGELAGRIGDLARRWQTGYARAGLAALEGDLAAAEAANDEALAMAGGLAESRAMAAYGGQLLEVRRLQGRLTELVPVVEDFLETQPATPAWLAAAALARTVEGDLRDDGRAEAHLRALVGLEGGVPEDFAWLAAWACAGRAAAALLERCDPDVVGSLADACRARLAPWAEQGVWQGTCCYGPVATPLALLAAAGGDAAQARAYVATGRAWAERVGGGPYLAELDSIPT